MDIFTSTQTPNVAFLYSFAEMFLAVYNLRPKYKNTQPITSIPMITNKMTRAMYLFGALNRLQ